VTAAVYDFEAIAAAKPHERSAAAAVNLSDATKVIMQANQELANIDLLFANLDFDGAEKIQERLQKEIKAQKPPTDAADDEEFIRLYIERMDRLYRAAMHPWVHP
jgi:hypothetical protein